MIDYQVQNLSGGELQRVALTLCLGKPADVYLIDEPSAYLDSEQRLHAAKVIKRLGKQIWLCSYKESPLVKSTHWRLNQALPTPTPYNLVRTFFRFILHAKKTAFVVEHDFIMATYLADRVIVFEGEPAKVATARKLVLGALSYSRR